DHDGPVGCRGGPAETPMREPARRSGAAVTGQAQRADPEARADLVLVDDERAAARLRDQLREVVRARAPVGAAGEPVRRSEVPVAAPRRGAQPARPGPDDERCAVLSHLRGRAEPDADRLRGTEAPIVP